MTKATFALRGRNPDVLTCIANLSNDAVFTPPEFANRMLDTLTEAWAADNDGANIWADPEVTFLDPFTKSGVFLREIVKRLTEGLEDAIPDLTKRVDHILTKQVFGIGTETLTALLARRSVYCSKYANGAHSIAKSFDTESGNIWFERTEHTWVGGTERILDMDADGKTIERTTNGRCKYCGASQKEYERDESLESHAYAFIHTDNIKARIAELFGDDMHFDVIIGNPPYQLGDGGGGTSAVPLYHRFVDRAKELDPRYLTMVVPSRWFTGGKGLDEFRDAMLADKRIRSIDDFLSASDVFPGVGLKGGVCYFLWDRDNPGLCQITTRYKEWPVSTATRPLLEPGSEVFVRFNEGVPILQKVMVKETGGKSVALPEERRFERLVSVRKPFGLASTFRGNPRASLGDLEIFQRGGKAFVARDKIAGGSDRVDAWKVFVGFAAPGTGNRDTYPHKVISTPFLGEPGQVSTESYLAIGPFGSRAEAESALSYMSCRLTRFLIQLHKASQNTTRKVYTFVPTQDWTRIWTDEDLYAKYGITDDEIAFIDSVVRPMELNDGLHDNSDEGGDE